MFAEAEAVLWGVPAPASHHRLQIAGTIMWDRESNLYRARKKDAYGWFSSRHLKSQAFYCSEHSPSCAVCSGFAGGSRPWRLMLGVSGKESSRREAFSEAASVPGTASGPNFGALPVEVGRAGGPRAARKGLGGLSDQLLPTGPQARCILPTERGACWASVLSSLLF